MAYRDYTRTEVIREVEDTTSGAGINYVWYVEVEDGRQFERQSWRSAFALAALFEDFDKLDPSEKKERFVPIDIALAGKPTIAAYLAGIHGMSRDEIAERMGVAPSTVQKYLARIDPNFRSGNQNESD